MIPAAFCDVGVRESCRLPGRIPLKSTKVFVDSSLSEASSEVSVKTHFESRWANHAARVVITLAAAALLFTLRPDLYGQARDQFQAATGWALRPIIVREYMQANRVHKLQVGAGNNSPAGWLNTDIVPAGSQAYLDITKPLPFADGSFQYIFGEHVIEHIPYEDGLAFFKEAHRILAPGGKIRMVTPNLSVYLALFNKPDPEHSIGTANYVKRKLEAQAWSESPDPACIILNNQMRWFGHQLLYTPALLRSSLEQAGFTQIRQYAAGESDDAVLKAIDFGPSTYYKDVNAFEAMAFEATR